jgi:hypothetical protein
LKVRYILLFFGAQFVLMQVLLDIEEALEIAKGVIGYELRILRDHLSFAGHDAFAIDKQGSCSRLARGFLAFEITYIT